MVTSGTITGIREALGLKKAAFAKKVGVHYCTVVRWESGESVPNKTQQKKLSKLALKKAVKEMRKKADKESEKEPRIKSAPAIPIPPMRVRQGYIIRLSNRNSILGGKVPVMFADKQSATTIADKLNLVGYEVVMAKISTYEMLAIIEGD